jgi:lipopolysaccharide export LptBFGC system permease protein LptF
LGSLAALSFNAKQSTVIWLAIVFACFIFGSQFHSESILKKIKNISLCAIAFIVVSFLLNPFMWRNPILSADKAFTIRQSLVQQQLSDIYKVSPASALLSPLERVSSLIGNLYFTPSAVVDTANYTGDLETEIRQYTNNFANRIFRSIFGGSIFLAFTLMGIYAVFRYPSPVRHREEVLLLVAGCLQFLFLSITVPLPFQRYVIPLVPTAIIFFAIGARKFIELIYKDFLRRPKKRSNFD